MTLENISTPDTPTTPQPCPDHVPPKFWDAEAGAVRTDALLKSYAELERHLGQKRTPDATTTGGRADLLKQLGHPEKPEDYAPDLSANVLKNDPALNAKLHALGFTHPQVQAVYDLAAERLVPIMQDMARDMRAAGDLERLRAQFGGPEKWAEMARQLAAYGAKHVPPGVLPALTQSYDGVMMLHGMMTAAGGTGKTAHVTGQGAPDDGVAALHKMIADPRYWKDRDPDFIAQVTAGFERVYDGK